MPVDIKAEIARRLDVPQDDLEPVLATVVERIRQQVSHYGYARLSGLGTFRGRDGSIIFEPDAVLAETVNLRFAGLEPIRLGAVEVDENRPATLHADSGLESRDFPEERPLSAFEEDDELETREADSDEARPQHDDLDELEDDEEAAPFDVSEGSDDEAVWQGLDEAADDHPLGPLPQPSYEDAEFSLVDDQDAGKGSLPALQFENDEEKERAMPSFGGAPVDEGDLGEESDESIREDESLPEDAGLPHGETRLGSEQLRETDEALDRKPGDADELKNEKAAGGKRTPAADRRAQPHERIRRDWPSESVDPAGLDAGDFRRNTILIAVGIIVLVAAAAVGYFALQPTEPTNTEIAAETDNQPATDTAAADLEGVVPPEAAADVEEEPAQTAPASTPLRSPEGLIEADGGFTIVVYSETSESSANQVAEQYAGEGFRSGMITSQEGGVARYRVGVGQFESLEEAMDARNELAGEQLPQDAWVYRLE